MTKTCLFSGDFSNDFTVPKGHGRRECTKILLPLSSRCVYSLKKMPQSDVFINSVTLRLTKPPRKKHRKE